MLPLNHPCATRPILLGLGFVTLQSGSREREGLAAEHGRTELCGETGVGEDAWNAPGTRQEPAAGLEGAGWYVETPGM